MKNLNKFTKHELISKLKNLDNQNSNQNSNKSTLIKIVEYLLYFKSLIFKLTLKIFIIYILIYYIPKKLLKIINLVNFNFLKELQKKQQKMKQDTLQLVNELIEILNRK